MSRDEIERELARAKRDLERLEVAGDDEDPAHLVQVRGARVRRDYWAHRLELADQQEDRGNMDG